MDSKALNRFAYQAMRRARDLSWQWMAFFVLLVASIGFYLSIVMPSRHTLIEAKLHAIDLQKNVNSLQQANADAARLTPSGQIERFEAYFPAESTAPDTLELILKEASKKGLVPKQAEYRVNRTTPGNVLAYQLTLPLKGTYPQLIEFIEEILPKVQNLALENIAFQRQKISDSRPDSTLMLTLYLKREH